MERPPFAKQQEMDDERTDQADRERAAGESAADERATSGIAPPTAPTEPAFEDRHEVPPVAEAPMEATPPGTAVPEAAERGPSATAPAPGSDDFEVFSRSEAERYTSRWDDLQASFVDDPKHATDNAKALVEEIMSRLRERYDALQREFDSGSETDGETERMRHRVRQYRSFFRTLVTVTSGDGAADE